MLRIVVENWFHELASEENTPAVFTVGVLIYDVTLCTTDHLSLGGLLFNYQCRYLGY